MDSPQIKQSICRTSATASARFESNTAMGIDHLLVPWATGDTSPGRADDCGTLRPNSVWAFENGAVSAYKAGFKAGLVTNTTNYADGLPARLQRIPASWNAATWGQRTVGGVTLDDRPLWKFIPSTVPSGVPSTCNYGPTDPYWNQTTLQTCLHDYTTGSYSPLFTAQSTASGSFYDIQMSPRVAFVPIFNTAPLNGAPTCSASGSSSSSTAQCVINNFRMVFIETVYASSSDDGNGYSDAGAPRFRPGEPLVGTISNWNGFDGIAALRIPESALPATVSGGGPNGSLRGATVQLVK
jgi:hypothetical protein